MFPFTGEDVKKINGSVFGNISSVEDRLGKFESTASDLTSKVSIVQKKTEGLVKEFELINSSRTRIENKLSQIESKVKNAYFRLKTSLTS